MADYKEEYDTREELDVMKEALNTITDSKDIAQDINEVLKDCAEDTGLEKSVVSAIRTYLTTQGRGWGETCLDKSECEDVTHPDIVAAAFRRIYNIIDTYAQCGMLAELQPYIAEMKNRGIDINVSINEAEENNAKIKSRLSIMKKYAEEQWELRDRMKGLCEMAEAQEIAPANKFSTVANLQHKIIYGSGKTDKLSQRINHESDLSIMYHDALKSL